MGLIYERVGTMGERGREQRLSKMDGEGERRTKVIFGKVKYLLILMEYLPVKAYINRFPR